MTVLDRNAAPIPRRFCFIWFGRELPLFAELAIRSALALHPAATATLFHGAELAADAKARLRDVADLTLTVIDVDSLLSAVERRAAGALDLPRLRQIWQQLKSPAARANLVRLFVLYAEGGVYLDTDTLTLRPLDPLLSHSGFCGLEHILWPKQRMSKLSFYYWLGGPLLMLARFILSGIPYGYRVQQKLLHWYSLAENNAVLAAAPGHRVLLRMLQRITELEESQWLVRFRLGTHLLQETLSELGASADFERLGPENFYPVGPVTSSHYFRKYSRASRVCEDLGISQALVVHWYASVAELEALDRAHVLENRGKTVFATLSAAYVSGQK